MAWYRDKLLVGNLKAGYLLLRDKNGDVFATLDEFRAGFASPNNRTMPLLQLLPNKTVMAAALDRVGVYLDVLTGKPQTRAPLAWTNTPSKVVYSNPYVVSMMRGAGIEVHDVVNKSSTEPAQRISLRDICALTGNGLKWDMVPRPTGDPEDSVFVATSEGKVLRVEQVRVEKQIQDLLERGDISAAQSLVASSFTASSSKRTADVVEKQKSRQRRFARQAGASLFFRMEFKEAFKYLLNSDMDGSPENSNNGWCGNLDVREILHYFTELQPQSECGWNTERLKLWDYLNDPKARYDPAPLLAKITNQDKAASMETPDEKATYIPCPVQPFSIEFLVLCGRARKHVIALDLLVNKLHAFNDAEAYAVRFGTRSRVGTAAARRRQQKKIEQAQQNFQYGSNFNLSYGQSPFSTSDEDEMRITKPNNLIMGKLLATLWKIKTDATDVSQFLKNSATSSAEMAVKADKFANNLLVKYAHTMDIHEVLNMLPASTPPRRVLRFLTTALPQSTARVRESSMTKNLANMFYQQQQVADVRYKRQSVTIDTQTRCGVCEKPIGETVFAVYPNHTIVHYSCTGGSLNKCPVTNEVFSET